MKKNIVLLILLTVSFTVYGQNFDNTVEKLIEENIDEIIELRHWFHQNAELSNREFKTAERIKNELIKIGYKPNTGIAKTGVVAILNEGKEGPVVGLRADIDGLPIKERVDIPWASKMTGIYNGEEVPVMHACGHDMHTAILLATAKILYELKDQIPGQVKFIFQPAEEGAPVGEEGGAELMVKEGVLKNPDVDAIFGLHVGSGFNVGNVAVRPKGIMAAVDEFRIDLKGKQTHGSRPWDGIDPIVTAAQMINSLQTIVSRNLELTEAAAVITVGAIHGGVRSNIIPEDLYMLGTIRTLRPSMRKTLLKRFEEVVLNLAEANNVEAKITYGTSYPITFNQPELYENMLPTLRRVNKPENVIFLNARTGAEDFSFFQQEIPGMYFFIGGSKEGVDPRTVLHHSPDFYVDDSAMQTGIRSMVALTLDFITKK